MINSIKHYKIYDIESLNKVAVKRIALTLVLKLCIVSLTEKILSLFCRSDDEEGLHKPPEKLEVATDSEEEEEEGEDKSAKKDAKGVAQTKLTVKMVNKWSKSLTVSI